MTLLLATNIERLDWLIISQLKGHKIRISVVIRKINSCMNSQTPHTHTHTHL